MPASPLSSTTCPIPAVAWSQRRCMRTTSSSRPTREGQAARRNDVESGLRPTLVQDPIDLERLGQAFERLRPERLTHKIAVDQVGGSLADHDRIWSRQALESCRHVWRLPQGEMLLPPATANLADHHQPGVDTEPHGQAHPVLLLQARIQRPQGLDHPEPAADGPLDRIFMGLGIAEVYQQAIAEVLGNVAVKALNDLGTGGLIGPHRGAEVFRIELARQHRRVHQVTNYTHLYPKGPAKESRKYGCKVFVRALCSEAT
jgi:hypothetical protein